MNGTTYQQAMEWLYSLRQFGIKPGLEKPRRLMALLGDPQEFLRFIHVAGTNGKGSTCAFLESIYRHAGLRVGLYTSPHLVHLGERFQVQRHPASEQEILDLLGPIRKACGLFPTEDHPTFFEITTAMALLHFKAHECDLVVWETGMGGRLDATNIVTPLASVITSIGWDHQQWLGDTLEKIAMEKAGIIKPGIPVVTLPQDDGVDGVVGGRADELGSAWIRVSPPSGSPTWMPEGGLPLKGRHQKDNAALAVAVVEHLDPLLPVTGQALRSGLPATAWKGRFQTLVLERRRIILDGAHNLDGVKCLLETLEQECPGVRPALILGMLQDKDWRMMARVLAPAMGRLVCVPVDNARSLNTADLLAECRAQNAPVRAEAADSLAEALQLTETESCVVVAGSLYLVGEALEILEPIPEARASERHVSEVGPKPPVARVPTERESGC